MAMQFFPLIVATNCGMCAAHVARTEGQCISITNCKWTQID